MDVAEFQAHVQDFWFLRKLLIYQKSTQIISLILASFVALKV